MLIIEIALGIVLAILILNVIGAKNEIRNFKK